MSDLPVPPQNRDAERALLGGLIRDPDVLPDVLAVVRPEGLYFDHHRRVFSAITDLAARGAPIDLVTLHTELQRRGELADVGGKEYLVELWEAVPTAANASYHARLVRDAFQLRGLIHAANEILRDAYSPTGPAEELVATAERKLFALNADAGPGASAEPRAIGEFVRESLSAIDDQISSGAELAGLSTGYDELDRLTGGLRAGELVVLGARPSLGKTALSLNIAERVARSGAPVLFFSLEMPGRDISDRLLSMESSVPMSRMSRARNLRPSDLEAIIQASDSAHLGGLPLYLEETPNASAAQVAAVSRRACRRFGVKLIVIDYLGLMAPENPKDNKAQQIGTLALRVKQMARALAVPVILLSQLNRDSEHARRRPQLSDLRESGDIEAHADRVILLHRDADVRNEDAVWPIEVIVGKNRNGPIGDVRLAYRRPVLRFENAAA